MRFTRLRPESSPHARGPANAPRTLAHILAVASCLAAIAGVASCSSNDSDGSESGPPDAAAVADAGDEGTLSDDAAADASPAKDAGPFDGAPLPIVCTSPPCATSLVTTLGVDADDRSEGFCALLTDGTVACWGTNHGGQLGRGDDAETGNVAPARVAGLSDVVDLDHTCAVDKNGATWCWGTGPFLQSDVAATTIERTPVKLPIPAATKVGMGATAACAMTGDEILCWGANTGGQVAPYDVAPWTAVLPPRTVTNESSPVRDLVVGNASFVLREDGVGVSWGASPPLARVSPLFPDPYPEPISLGGVSMIDLANDNGCAAAGGIGYCWGADLPRESGGGFALPIDPSLDRALPEPVVIPEPILQIATTRMILSKELAIYQPQRWCATAVSGAVYCAGYNASGQVGDGTKNYAYEAARVIGLPAPAAAVKTLPDSTCALLTTGKIFCWGSDGSGQLGIGTIKPPSVVPLEVMLP